MTYEIMQSTLDRILGSSDTDSNMFRDFKSYPNKLQVAVFNAIIESSIEKHTLMATRERTILEELENARVF